MSERQAKIKRKNDSEVVVEKKKSAADIISNIVITVLVLAVLGVGVWAMVGKYKPNSENEQTIPTISEYAATEGTTAEDFIAQYGLTNVTGETSISDAISSMTLGNYAKFSKTDVETVKQSMGIAGDYTEDTLMSDIFAQMQATGESTENQAENTAE